MHIFSINFISFRPTAQIYNALHMQGKQGDFGILGAMAPLPPTLNPPMCEMNDDTTTSLLSSISYRLLVAWRSGNELCQISEVALPQARLVLVWMTV